MNAESPISDLITLEIKDAFAIYTSDNPVVAMSKTLAPVRAHIDAWACPGVETDAGRKQIASLAYRIARAKGVLEKVGKDLADDAKSIPKRIDATRNHVRATLDAWRDEVRAPLDAWEAAEAARKAGHASVLDRLMASAQMASRMTSDELRATLDEVGAVDPSAHEEFAAEVEIAKASLLAAVTGNLSDRMKAEAEAAELALLRAEKAERDRKVREEEIAAQSAAAAVARERAAAELRERQLREERDAAERRAVEAAERAKAELDAAKRAEDDAARRREADKANRKKINQAAVAALVNAGIGEDSAKTVITMIARGEVPAVSIRY